MNKYTLIFKYQNKYRRILHFLTAVLFVFSYGHIVAYFLKLKEKNSN